MNTQNKTSNTDKMNSVVINEQVLKKLQECKFDWQRNLLLKQAWKVTDVLYDAFSTEAEYPDSHPTIDDFGDVVPKELGMSALIVYHCAQQHDDVGYWTYGYPTFHETKINGNTVVFASECKEMLKALFVLRDDQIHRHLEKVKDKDTLIDLTFPRGDRLYLGKNKSEFFKVGEVQYIQLTYLELTTMYLTEEEIQAGRKGYLTNQTEYFPSGEQKDIDEAVKAFDMRLNSRYPYRSTKKSYNIEEIKSINDSRKKQAV